MRVSHVLDLLSVGFYIAKILEYPQLTREDILACMAYGAEMSRERFVDMSLDPQSEYIRISLCGIIQVILIQGAHSGEKH